MRTGGTRLSTRRPRQNSRKRGQLKLAWLITFVCRRIGQYCSVALSRGGMADRILDTTDFSSAVNRWQRLVELQVVVDSDSAAVGRALVSSLTVQRSRSSSTSSGGESPWLGNHPFRTSLRHPFLQPVDAVLYSLRVRSLDGCRLLGLLKPTAILGQSPVSWY